uniref:Uncharacterized protein n=1 Tax=Anopheles farauti TaxID=69004 RepID=A0A182QB68_9DIPT
MASTGEQQRPSVVGGGGHYAFREKCRQWNERLVEADAFSCLVSVYQNICSGVGRSSSSGRMSHNAPKTDEMPSTETDQNGTDDTAVPVADPRPLPVEEHYVTPEEKLRQSLSATMCDTSKTHAQRKIVSKAHYSVCYESLQLGLIEPDAISGMDDLDDADLNSVAIFGMLNSCFFRYIRSDPGLATRLANRNLGMFLATCNYSRFFNTLAENVLALEKLLIYPDVAGTRTRYLLIWKAALMNLESPYHGTRENMFALIKWVARDDQFMRTSILPDVSCWSWTNRNKLHMLGVLLYQYRLGSLMEGLKLNQAMFAEGVMLSLRYKHLNTGGQMLVRLLLRGQQMAELVYEMVVHVVHQWDVEQLLTMGKYWFSSFEPRDLRCIYEMLELERIVSEAVTRDGDGEVKQLPAYLRANRHEKLFHLALFFRRELHCHPQLPQYLTMLCELAEGGQPGTPDASVPIPAITRGMLIEALGYHITTDQPAGTENVINVLQFTKKLAQHVLEMIETPAATKTCTANAVVCQRLLRHIVSTQATFDKDAQAVVTKLMSYEMYDRYLLPVGPTKQLVYQPTIIALRMFSCFVNVFFEFTPSSQHVLQTRPINSIQWIVKLLPSSLGIDDLASSFRSMLYGLQHLFRCDFEDVRTITLQMLYNKGNAYNFDPSLQARLGELFSRNDPTELGESLTALLDDTLRRLRGAIVAHQEDFYAATLEEENDPNTQLYRLIDRVTEIVFGQPEHSPEVMNQLDVWPALRCVVLVVELTLRLLNAAKDPGESPYTGTSFAVMEQSIQMLLDKSDMWNGECHNQETGPSSAQVALAKRCLMGALWKAVRSAATALECCALWMVDQYLSGANDKPYLVRIAEYLRHLFNITIQCCHRGAVEAAGTSLGRIARRIMMLRQTVLTAAGTNDDPCITRGERFTRTRNIVAMFEGFFLNCLKEHKLSGNDFRRYRGYLWAIHCCIRSEIEGGSVVDGSLLRLFLDEHVQLGSKTCTVVEKELTERMNGFDCEEGLVGVLELHQLNLLARETLLSEAILPQIDDMLLMALTHFNHADWEVRNAAVQLYASCVTKVTGQPQQYRDPHCDWPPVYVSIDEILRKLPATLGYAVLKLQRIVNGGRENNRYNQTTPFILLVLELLSKVEYRAYQLCERSLVLNFRAIMWSLLQHEHEKVRTMAARCYAQLHDFRREIPNQLENMVVSLFTSAKGENFRHGLCVAVAYCLKKQVTLGRFIANEPVPPAEFQAATTSVIDSREQMLTQIRDLITVYYPLDEELQLESPYRFRCVLLDLLLYVGFDRHSEVLLQLIYNRVAPNSHGLEVFLMQANRIFGTGTDVPHSSGTTPAREQDEDTESEDELPLMPYEIELEPQPHDDNVVFDIYEN